MNQLDVMNETVVVRETDGAVPATLNAAAWPWRDVPPATGVYLAWTEDGLCLCRAGEKGRVSVEFAAGAARHRRVQGGGELLAKAVQAAQRPVVWDATGGLGRDAFVLAGLGLQVSVFERHPWVWALLCDGVRRGMACADTAAVLARMTVLAGDAAVLMPELATTQRPDVVYLDPMYPERQKSAAVKKEMAYFHDLVGVAQNDAALLDAALRVARRRVVVKRPRQGVVLCGRQPDYQYWGKSTRFDVYRPAVGDETVEAT